MKKKFKEIFRVVIIIAIITEIASGIGLFFCRKIAPDLFWETGINEFFQSNIEHNLKNFQSVYHPILGWDLKPNQKGEQETETGGIIHWSVDRYGARKDEIETAEPYVTVYGDSFAFCAETSDNQTWPYFLEKSIQKDVHNYGVPIYGTYQALLKYKLHLHSGLYSHIAVLCIYEENVERVVNANRFYLNKMTNPLGYAPFLRRFQGRIKEFKNPLNMFGKNMIQPDVLKTAALKSAEIDYWAGLKLNFGFPNSYQLLRTVFRRLKHEICASPNGLWSSREGKMVMDFTIGKFVELARENNAKPVILFVPDVQKWKEGRRAPNYEEYRVQLRKIFPEELIIDIAEADFDPEKFNVAPFKGHASEYGNRIIAVTIAKKIDIPTD